MFGRSKSLVGLDIGSSAVKAIELKPAGKAYKVSAFGSQPVPPDSIVDGAIIDGTAVVDAIRRLFDSLKVSTKDVAASLSGNAVIVKKISLPSMTEAELAESIYWEAEQYIPFDIQDVNLDYQILDRGDVGGKSTMEVLLVAAKKEKIADYTGVIGQAGRVAVVIDVDAFALQNAYEVNYGTEPGRGRRAAQRRRERDQHQHPARRPVGVHARHLDRRQRLHRGAAEGTEPAVRAGGRAQAGDAVDGVTFDDARPVLRAVTENVMLEVQKTFDFFKTSAAYDKITRIVVSGGASRAEGFTEMLTERFQAPVELFDPFKRVAFDAAKFGVDAADVAPTAAVAVGLALRRAGDR